MEMRTPMVATRRLVRVISRGMGTPAAAHSVRGAAQAVRPNWRCVWDSIQEHASVLCYCDADTLLVRVVASTAWTLDAFDAVVCCNRGVWWARVRTQDPEPMVCLDGGQAFDMVADAAVRWSRRPRADVPMPLCPLVPIESLDHTVQEYMSIMLFL